eukprot:7382600-Prymnesium_polylepis.1
MGKLTRLLERGGDGLATTFVLHFPVFRPSPMAKMQVERAAEARTAVCGWGLAAESGRLSLISRNREPMSCTAPCSGPPPCSSAATAGWRTTIEQR